MRNIARTSSCNYARREKCDRRAAISRLTSQFITHMVEHGVPLGTIQSFVGHTSARMIRHYTHISTGAARRAAAVLAYVDNSPDE